LELFLLAVLNSDVTVLRQFLAAPEGIVPGPKLAQLLGVTRVSIWTQLRRLEREGFAFEVVRRRGYRLVAKPPHLHHALLLAHLHGRPRLPEIVCLNITDSTNSEAERRLAEGARVPLVILARRQTAGRGRRGRAWHSASTGNLYATFVFRPDLEPARMQDFTLWMGLNVCELISSFCLLQPALKWPNDVHLGGRKAGGMLTEARVDADQIRELVFGLGLNLNTRAADFPRELQRTATSLAEAGGQPVDFNRFTAALVGRVLQAYGEFVSGAHRKNFADLWARYDCLAGQPVTVTQGERVVTGTAQGIDDAGSLLVRLDTGKIVRFPAGEVTLAKPA
jgi:BirA family biotin operon repressor/biotin-[acetyl-CoA-carboxylase] ligase